LEQYTDDGTRVYLEQTCHHPPITHMLFEGPEGIYRMDGWNSFQAKAWLNSVALYVQGHKRITFNDGSFIQWNNQGVRMWSF